MMRFCDLVLCLVAMVTVVKGHGYLAKPAQRSSAWRSGYNTPINYGDNELFCGGFGEQFNTVNDGKCGVCGDPYSQAPPRDNEAGGKYVNATITGSYGRGSVIQAEVVLTANHKGYFEFRLCPHNNFTTTVTQECLDENVLEIVGNGTRHNISTLVGVHNIAVKLPESVTCDQCVLQWTYVTGNSWGCDGNACAVGLGNQEHFINCADIKIHDGNHSSTSPESTTQSSTETSSPKPSTTTTATTSTPQPTATTVKPITTTKSTTTTTTITTATVPTSKTTTTTTTTIGGQTGIQCTGAINITCDTTPTYAATPGMDKWCLQNCFRGHCPPSHCICTC